MLNGDLSRTSSRCSETGIRRRALQWFVFSPGSAQPWAIAFSSLRKTVSVVDGKRSSNIR